MLKEFLIELNDVLYILFRVILNFVVLLFLNRKLNNLFSVSIIASEISTFESERMSVN